MIVSIILNILKIIGFILLGILGLVLALLLVVLFVPVRYKVCAICDMDETKKEYRIKVKMSWLLGLLRMKYDYPDENGFVLKAGPFSIFGNKKRKQVLTKKCREKKIKPEKENTVQKVKEEFSENKTETKNENVLKNENVSENEKSPETIEKIENKKKRKSLKEKIILTRDRFCDKIKKILIRIRDIIKNIKKYHAILKSTQFQESFALCKHSLKRFLKMIKPAKVKMDLKAGFSDPEKTGYLCAAVGVVSPFLGKGHMHVEPDFEQFIINGKAMVKGKVYVFIILIIGLKLYFDKNIRKVADMFQKEEIIDE